MEQYFLILRIFKLNHLKENNLKLEVFIILIKLIQHFQHFSELGIF